jgi:hypothetical protein
MKPIVVITEGILCRELQPYAIATLIRGDVEVVFGEVDL